MRKNLFGQHYIEPPTAMQKVGNFLNAAKEYTPIGSAEEITGQLSGTRPASGLKAGLAGADLASLGLGSAEDVGLKAFLKMIGRGDVGSLAKMAGESALHQAPAAAGAGLAGGAAAASGHPFLAIPAAIAGGGAADLARMGVTGALDANRGISPGIRELEAAGAKPTAYVRNPTTLTRAGEGLSNMDLMSQGALEQSRQSVADAVRNVAQARFGQDIFEPRAERAGGVIKSAMENAIANRSADYQPAVDALAQSKLFPGMKRQILQAAQVAAGNTRTGIGDAAIRVLADNLSRDTTPTLVDRSISNFKAALQSAMGAPLTDQAAHDAGLIKEAASDAYYAQLNKLSKGGTLGDHIRDIKGDYAEATQGIKPAAKVMSMRYGKPEALPEGILNLGSKHVGAFLENLDPVNRKTVQEELARTILSKAFDPTKPAGMTSASLEKALAKYKDVVPLLGTQEENLKDFSSTLKASKVDEIKEARTEGAPIRHQLAGAMGETGLAGMGLARAASGHPIEGAGMVGAAAIPPALSALYTRAGVPIQKMANFIPKTGILRGAMAPAEAAFTPTPVPAYIRAAMGR